MININLNNISIDSEYIERFIVEIVPRFREIGKSTVVTNNTILSDDFLKSVRNIKLIYRRKNNGKIKTFI